MSIDAILESALRRDRRIVLALLGLVMIASWGYVLAGAGMGMSAVEMTRMSGMDQSMAGPAMSAVPWSPDYAVTMFFMWWIMMVAMMLPGATPMILLFAAVNRRQRQQGSPAVATSIFTASYLLAWAGFSLGAVLVHWALAKLGLVGPDMALSSAVLGAGVLIAAGLYQATPIKRACISHCRSPVAWLAAHWRPGARGAWRMGLHHGAYCLGCCWVLMLLLFFGGVMNLYWIAGLALYVLVEKILPAGHWLDYALGALLVAAGGWVLVAAIAA